jgi:hypothetical protein
VAGKVVQGVRNRQRETEIRGVDARHAAVAHRPAAVAQGRAALDLEVRPVAWIRGIGVEGRCTRRRAAETRPGLDHQLKA